MATPNAELYAEIETKLDWTTDQLETDIGRSASKAAILPDYIMKGREIYTAVTDNLQDAICSDQDIISAYRATTTHEDKVLLISAIVDCISGYITGISPATVAVLLFKQGIGGYCKDRWEDKVVE